MDRRYSTYDSGHFIYLSEDFLLQKHLRIIRFPAFHNKPER